METRLQEIFKNTNDWLKFAEAKSAALMAGNGVLAFGVLRLLQNEDYGKVMVIYSFLAILQLALSFVISLTSFIPSLEMPWLFKNTSKVRNENLIYFEHIASHSPKSYLIALSHAINEKDTAYTKFEQMIASQIITNSVITVKKYKLFKIAAWLTLSSIATPLGAFFLYKLK